MSSAPLRPTPDLEKDERRSHPRTRLDRLAYIGFGPDVGGVLLDISEDGLRCQIIGSFIEGDQCHLKFALPGTRSPIEVDGQVIWSNISKQGGGVRLLGLRPDARRNIQQWIQDEIAGAGAGKPIPIRVRAKTLAAPPVPQPSPPGPAGPAAEPPTVPRKLHTVPMPRRSENAAVQTRLAAKAARKNAVAKKGAIQPAEPTAAVRLVESLKWHQATRSINIPVVVLLGCILGALAALGLSGFNSADLLFLTGLAEATPPIVTPAASPAAIPSDPPKATAAPESESPAPAKAAVLLDPHASNQFARRETAVPNPIQASQPPPAPKVPEPASRPQMAMTLPQPRAISPAAAPAVALPELAAAPTAPSIDMSLVESPSPQHPPPGKPQIVSDYRPSKLISRIEPMYSTPAKQARLQGTVTVDVTVGPDGSARSSVCIEGNALLCRMAVEAISKWRYQPATSNGLPVASQTRVNFNFQLH